MEENESQNQQSEVTPEHERLSKEWLAPVDQPAVAPKNPDDTPTGELVADYEALLAHIKVRKVNHDERMAILDAQRSNAIVVYEAAIKGASVEAAKLLVLISKRLGIPLNGARPVRAQSVSQERLAVQGGKKPNPQTACEVCGKLLGNGMGMHMQMHARRGEAEAAPKTRPHRAAAGGNQTRWCESCGTAIHVKGWSGHQAAHQRHGSVLPRKIENSGKRYRQSMSDEKIKALLIGIRSHQPVGYKELGQHLGMTTSISAFMSGLKERGLAINNDKKWTLTPKGAAYIG